MNNKTTNKCCVVKCSNTSLRLFDFPRPLYRSYQRGKWLQALKKINGYRWNPTGQSVVCGNHFLTGEPNSDSRHPDYVPHVFTPPSTPAVSAVEEEPPAAKQMSVSVKQFALEYIKYDVLLEEPSKNNVDSEHRKRAYEQLSKALRITVPMAKAWELRFRANFLAKMRSLWRRSTLAPRWMSRVEERLQVIKQAAKKQSVGVSPADVVQALRSAAAARGRLCSSALYRDVRRALRLGIAVSDLHAVWISAQRVSLEQVICAGRAGDKQEAAAPQDAADVADLVLLHTDVDVNCLLTEESVTLYEESAALHTLWQLVQRHRLEEPAPKGSRVRAQRWTRAHQDYRDTGRVCSLVVLQRRWHELKRLARRRLAAHWRHHAPPAARAPRPPPPPPCPRPAPLHLAILKRYPHIATQPAPSWRQLVLAGLVVTEPLQEDELEEGNVNEQVISSECSESHMDVDPEATDPTEEDSNSLPSAEQGAADDNTTDDTKPIKNRLSSECDTEDNLVIDEVSINTLCTPKHEQTEHTAATMLTDNKRTGDTGSTHNADGIVAPTVQVLHTIDPSTVKTEIIFDSDEDETQPFEEHNKVKIRNRIMFDDDDVFDAKVDVKKEDKGDLDDKSNFKGNLDLEGDLKVEDYLEKDGIKEKDNVDRDDDTDEGDEEEGDTLEQSAWDSGQRKEELNRDQAEVEGEGAFDQKLLMDTTVELIKIDELPFWEKHLIKDTTIKLSQINTKLLEPNTNRNVHNDQTYEIKVDEFSIAMAAKTYSVRRLCNNIKRELIENSLQVPNKKIKTEPDLDSDDQPLLRISEKLHFNSTDDDNSRDMSEDISKTDMNATRKLLQRTVKRKIVIEREMEESSSPSEQEGSDEEFTLSSKRPAKKVKKCNKGNQRWRHNAASTIEWSAGFESVFGARVAKRVRLPDIETVRRVNSAILTAEVAPITAQVEPAPSQPAGETQQVAVEDAWADSLPSGQQLELVLNELSTLATAEQVLDATHCCAARRHRVINDTRRRYGFPDIPLHNHGGGACACCCAHLCDSGQRARLRHQLAALHHDIDNIITKAKLVNWSEKYKKKKDTLPKKDSSQNIPRRPTKSTTTKATTSAKITVKKTAAVIEPTPAKMTTPLTKTTETMLAKVTPRTTATIITTKNASAVTVAASTSVKKTTRAKPSLAPVTELSTDPINDYEEWQRQKNINAQHFRVPAFNFAGVNKLTASSVTPSLSSLSSNKNTTLSPATDRDPKNNIVDINKPTPSVVISNLASLSSDKKAALTSAAEINIAVITEPLGPRMTPGLVSLPSDKKTTLASAADRDPKNIIAAIKEATATVVTPSLASLSSNEKATLASAADPKNNVTVVNKSTVPKIIPSLVRLPSEKTATLASVVGPKNDNAVVNKDTTPIMTSGMATLTLIKKATLTSGADRDPKNNIAKVKKTTTPKVKPSLASSDSHKKPKRRNKKHKEDTLSSTSIPKPKNDYEEWQRQKNINAQHFRIPALKIAEVKTAPKIIPSLTSISTDKKASSSPVPALTQSNFNSENKHTTQTGIQSQSECTTSGTVSQKTRPILLNYDLPPDPRTLKLALNLIPGTSSVVPSGTNVSVPETIASPSNMSNTAKSSMQSVISLTLDVRTDPACGDVTIPQAPPARHKGLPVFIPLPPKIPKTASTYKLLNFGLPDASDGQKDIENPAKTTNNQPELTKVIEQKTLEPSPQNINVPGTHNQKENTINSEPRDKNISILEQYARLLATETPATLNQLTPTNALSLQLPNIPGAIIMSLCQKVAPSQVNLTKLTETIDLTADSDPSDLQNIKITSQEEENTKKCIQAIPSLLEPLLVCKQPDGLKLYMPNRLYDGDYIELDDDSDPGQSSNPDSNNPNSDLDPDPVHPNKNSGPESCNLSKSSNSNNPITAQDSDVIINTNDNLDQKSNNPCNSPHSDSKTLSPVSKKPYLDSNISSENSVHDSVHLKSNSCSNSIHPVIKPDPDSNNVTNRPDEDSNYPSHSPGGDCNNLKKHSAQDFSLKSSHKSKDSINLKNISVSVSNNHVIKPDPDLNNLSNSPDLASKSSSHNPDEDSNNLNEHSGQDLSSLESSHPNQDSSILKNISCSVSNNHVIKPDPDLNYVTNSPDVDSNNPSHSPGADYNNRKEYSGQDLSLESSHTNKDSINLKNISCLVSNNHVVKPDPDLNNPSNISHVDSNNPLVNPFQDSVHLKIEISLDTVQPDIKPDTDIINQSKSSNKSSIISNQSKSGPLSLVFGHSSTKTGLKSSKRLGPKYKTDPTSCENDVLCQKRPGPKSKTLIQSDLDEKIIPKSPGPKSKTCGKMSDENKISGPASDDLSNKSEDDGDNTSGDASSEPSTRRRTFEKTNNVIEDFEKHLAKVTNSPKEYFNAYKREVPITITPDRLSASNLLCVDAASRPFKLRKWDATSDNKGFLILTKWKFTCTAPTYWTISSYFTAARIVALKNQCNMTPADGGSSKTCDADGLSSEAIVGDEESLQSSKATSTNRRITRASSKNVDKGLIHLPQRQKSPVRRLPILKPPVKYQIFTAVCSIEEVRALAMEGAPLCMLNLSKGRIEPLRVRYLPDGEHRRKYQVEAKNAVDGIQEDLAFLLNGVALPIPEMRRRRTLQRARNCLNTKTA